MGNRFGNVTLGLTMGTFDVLHCGHIRMLADASSKCDFLTVAVQIDPTVDRPDKKMPVQSIEERVEQVLALKSVDEVITYTTEKELYDILLNTEYDVRIMGSDWEGKQFTGIDIPGHKEKCYFHYRDDHGYSSTELRERVFLAEYERRFGTIPKV